MSTPEQPATPALTRKQLRDIRNTGATPIITDEPSDDTDVPVEGESETYADTAQSDQPEFEPESEAESEPEAEAAEPSPDARVEEAPSAVAAVAAPLPRAALPVAVHDLPGADAAVDLGVTPLTRRQARQQERIRTASVPVITPDVAAAHAASVAAGSTTEHAPAPAGTAADEPAADSRASSLAAIFQTDFDEERSTEEREHDIVLVEAGRESEQDDLDDTPDKVDESADDVDDTADEREVAATDDEDTERAIVHPGFGSELLAGAATPVELPPSFDQLISRSATGSIGTGNALILSQTPSAQPLVAPITATGEVLITGSFNLPEGLGSTGHATGTADGKDVDAVLIDGELPAHSSPTPIAASAAISTVKSGGDIIKPPTPEKGGRLMLTLAITAGVLALALVGVLILAFVTGVF
jgi:hypothetical protein